MMFLLAGILLHSGFWFNLKTEEWEQLRFPPYAEHERTPNQMTSFRGKPTVFGNTVCDAEGECVQEEVIQYNEDTDSWKRIGEMLHYRGFSTIVEVPQEFCEAAQYPEPSTDTAAVIIGGINTLDVNSESATILNSVELFGCPNSLSIPLDNFPTRIYVTGGVHFVLDEVNNPMGRIVVCGGVGCTINGLCEEQNTCWELDTTTLSWSQADYALLEVRYGHVMSLSPDFDSGTNNRVPMVSGGSGFNEAAEETEIWDALAEEWKSYR